MIIAQFTPNRAGFHGSGDFTQSKHRVGEEVERAAADDPIEDSVLKWQFLDAGAS